MNGRKKRKEAQRSGFFTGGSEKGTIGPVPHPDPLPQGEGMAFACSFAFGGRRFRSKRETKQGLQPGRVCAVVNSFQSMNSAHGFIIPGGNVELTVECQAGRSYDVEVSNNFQAWNLLTSFLSTNANMKVQDSPGGRCLIVW